MTPDTPDNDTEQPADESTGTGWLLPIPGDLMAAVGESEMIYVFPFEPEIFPIPNTPPYARGVIVWRKRLVPVIDLNVFLRPESVAISAGKNEAKSQPENTQEDESRVGESAIGELLALFTFQLPREAAGVTGLGALLLSDVPQRVVVSDEHACELPDDLGIWNSMAISCFSHETHGAVPILDLAALFSSSAVPPQSPNENMTQTSDIDFGLEY